MTAERAKTMHRHCDEYINDPSTPESLRSWLRWARSPAHGLLMPRPYPVLFAEYEGERVRVTMASRLGDVGITHRLEVEHGYDRRVYLSELSNFHLQVETPKQCDHVFETDVGSDAHVGVFMFCQRQCGTRNPDWSRRTKVELDQVLYACQWRAEDGGVSIISESGIRVFVRPHDLPSLYQAVIDAMKKGDMVRSDG